MTIFKELEDLKKQLEEAEKEAPEQVEEVEAEPEEVVEEHPKEEEKEPEKVVEPPVEEKPVDDAGFARLRREKAAAEKEAQSLRAQIEELKQAKEAPVEVETQAFDPVLAEVIQDFQFQKAGLEFNALEDNFRKTTPDYDGVSNAYKQALAQSIRVQNPRLPIDSVIKEANRQLLVKAAAYMQKGFDPIEEMYHEAKDLGFSAPPKAVEQEEKKEIKPDLDKIAANRARNAGTAAAKGTGTSGQLTGSTAATLTAKEWAALPKAEKDRILNGG